MGLIWVLIFISYTNPNKTRKNPVGKDMGVVFQYPMGTGTGMGTIFENGYGYGYGSTRPVPAPLPFLGKIPYFNADI